MPTKSSDSKTGEDLKREILPIPDVPRTGFTTYDAKDPETKFPAIRDLRPPRGAPNVLIILIDDAGFGAEVRSRGCNYRARREYWRMESLCQGGRLKYCYNLGGVKQFYVESTTPIPAGEHQVRMEFEYAGGGLGKGGKVTLYVDGKKIGEGTVPMTQAMVFLSR